MVYEYIVNETNSQNEIKMQRNNYFFVDRTLGVSINLSKFDKDLDKLIRIPIQFTSNHKDEILEIAINSFMYDRRFNIKPDCDEKTRKDVLLQWIEEINSFMVCFYKEKLIGFLALKEISQDILFIHLAAVDRNHRLTGAAISLYASAVKYAKEKGYKQLKGRISSQNTAVMNLYSFLGASFETPQDIFIEGIKTC